MNVPVWDLIGVPESAGLECWWLWSQQQRHVEEHRKWYVGAKRAGKI